MNPLQSVLLAAGLFDPAVWSREEIVGAAVGFPTAAATAFLVSRFVRRVPWPRPFRLRFAAVHLIAFPVATAICFLVARTIQSLVLQRSIFAGQAGRWDELLVIGGILYAIVAGLTYAVEGAARAARAEAVAARTQLAALRAQLHPHFLFNALHTVVQLIPVAPARAAEAAELVADLLRATIEQQRDEIALADEWSFVSRYLAVERMRFGDRLLVRSEIAGDLLDERVPSFALQTLVENAVRHGAEPRVAATEVVVTASVTTSELTLSVRDTGNGAAARAPSAGGVGTGLARLRERLAVLHGRAARLECGPAVEGGFLAVLTIPRHRGRAA